MKSIDIVLKMMYTVVMNSEQAARKGEDVSMSKAVKIKDMTNFQGDAILCKLEPPFEYEDWDDEKHTVNFVIVSAANVMFSGPETYIFKSDSVGEIEDCSELEGSYRGGLNHAVALRGMGYELTD